MGTPVTGFGLSVLFAELREAAADFAANLASEFPVVEIEIFGRSVAMRTGRANRYIVGPVAVMDGLQRMALRCFKMSQQLLPV